MRRAMVAAGLCFIAFQLAPAAPAWSAPRQLSMVVGTQAGTMTRLGTGIMDVFNKASQEAKVTLVPGGGRANPERLGGGGADFGFTFSSFAYSAYNGRTPFKKSFRNLRGVIKLWDSVYHQYIGKEVYESGIRSWEDIIKSKRPLGLGLASRGTSTEYLGRSIVAGLGSSYDGLQKRGFKLTFTGIGESSRDYRGKQIDVFFHNAGAPNAAGLQAILGRPTVFMEMSKPVVEKLKQLGFSEMSIPANTYKGISKDAHSVGDSGVLLTTDKMNPAVVYSLLKITHESKKTLVNVHSTFKGMDPKTSWKGTGVPLHEGAKRYYSEQGVNVN